MGASMSTLQPRRRGVNMPLPFEDCERPAKTVCFGVGLSDQELQVSSADLGVLPDQSSVEAEGEPEIDTAAEIELEPEPESKGEPAREQKKSEIEPEQESEPKDEGKPDTKSVDQIEQHSEDNIKQDFQIMHQTLYEDMYAAMQEARKQESHNAGNALLTMIEGIRVPAYYTLTLAEKLITCVESTLLEEPEELQREAVQEETVSWTVIDRAVDVALDKEREDILCRHFERAMILPLTEEEKLCRDFKRAIVMPSNPTMNLDDLKNVSFVSTI
ncbi:hypothetical protein FGRMN_5293 [Fusarium graminum]|nr:hypothetical protein FGRMN_5293 [Fusarium graminum]